MRFITIIFAIIALAAPAGFCAQNIEGTLLSVAADSGAIVLDTGKLAIAKDAKVMRGQIGKELRTVELTDLAQGDHIVAVVKQNGTVSSVKGFFGVVIGVAAGLQGNKLTFDDSRSVTLADNAQVILGDGSIGKPANIKRGMLVKCRVNPASTQAWTVFAAMPDKKNIHSVKDKPKKTTKSSLSSNKTGVIASPVQPIKLVLPAASPSSVGKDTISSKTQEKPKILSVTYSAPSPLAAGDILTVDMSGTPGGKATFEVKGLIKPSPLQETNPGSYHGSVDIPNGKSVRGAALVAKLMVNGVNAPAVQASRLVTIEENTKDQPAVMQTIAKKSEPVEITPAVQPAPVPQVVVAVAEPVVDRVVNLPPTAPAKITLTNPPDGANISRAILVRGTAEPDSNVLVNITYTNGLNGILRLSGEVASQRVAVGKNGEFRVGPIALEGPLATQGLDFTIKAYYPDQEDHATAIVKAKGTRS